MTTYSVVRAQGDEDVFVDEGDGDFDAVPPMPDASPGNSAQSAPAAPVEEPPTASAIDEAFEEVPPASEPVAAPKKKAPVVKAAPAKSAPKASTKSAAKSSAKPGKGKFVVTKEACKALREPASEETLFTTGASRKIWVEIVDEQWVRGFNKAGEPGYISTDCVE